MITLENKQKKASSQTHISSFDKRVRDYLRHVGYNQKDLAQAIGLHPGVLGRKLHGTGGACLNHHEIKRILLTLATWRAFFSQREVIDLLRLVELTPRCFSKEEWDTAPLSELLADDAFSFPDIPPPSIRSVFPFLPSPITQLVGREREMQQLNKLLRSEAVRLVTLTGAAGTGKTRLALEAAARCTDVFPDGIWFVSLASVNDPASVPMAILHSLGCKSLPTISPVQHILQFLQDKQGLLVLDNFEHVLDAALLVSNLLTAAPFLKVLLTSRSLLHLYGEYEFQVPPLEVPAAHIESDIPTLMQYGAIQLLVERIQATTHDFVLTTENAPIVAQICRCLDGLPLALELAAAQTKALPLRQLLQRLSTDRLSLLVSKMRNIPDRQRTLRKAIAWGDQLLPLHIQQWFTRLSVFRGGWFLEAIDAMLRDAVLAQHVVVTPTPLSSCQVLEQLVDQSLIIRVPHESASSRFTMLETLREYALEQAAARGELELLRDWHAIYYTKMAEMAVMGLRDRPQNVLLWQMSAEKENFQAALAWLYQRAKSDHVICFLNNPSDMLDTDLRYPVLITGSGTYFAGELYQRLVAALGPYWEWQNAMQESGKWLKTAL